MTEPISESSHRVAPAAGLRPRPQASLVVYYDEGCGPCTRTALAIDRWLNWLGRVRFAPAAGHPTAGPDAYRDIHSSRADGRSFVGFATYRQIAWRCPPLWPLALLMVLPPVSWLGRRIYRGVADGRDGCQVTGGDAGGSAGRNHS
jgi:predicted DCC family thiol-disulfide oxidoreductase YuxK